MHPVDRSLPVDVVRIDAIYNPVRRANFMVAETRVGQRTDYDRLTVTVETNGTISPEDALAYAAALAQEHFRYFVEFGKVPAAREPVAEGSGGEPEPQEPAGPVDRRLRAFGPVAQLAQELEHPHAARPGRPSAKTNCSRSRTWAKRPSPKSGNCCEREGLTFSLQFEDVDGELRVRSKSDIAAAPTTVEGA